MLPISLIVPVYKTYKQLNRCISSISAQTYCKFEIVIVDDGTPDSSSDLCDEIAIIDNRIKVVHKCNGGLSSARKFGFIYSGGENILFIDSDDYIELTMVEKLQKVAKISEADLVICSYAVNHRDKEQKCQLPLSSNNIISRREEIIEKYVKPLLGKDSSSVNLPGFLCIRLHKRSLIQRNFFASERIYFLEDHVFDLQYADNVSRIAVVNEPLYHYCVNAESLTNIYRPNKWKMYQDLLLFYQEYIASRGIIGCEIRMKNFQISSLLSSIDNAVNSGCYKNFRNELVNILKSFNVKALLYDDVKKEISFSQRIYLVLCQYRVYLIIYLYRRWRLSKNLK